MTIQADCDLWASRPKARVRTKFIDSFASDLSKSIRAFEARVENEIDSAWGGRIFFS